MLYLNDLIANVLNKVIQNLTLTSVVFEWVRFSFRRPVSKYLTLTSVVFEFWKKCIYQCCAWYLTLTSVVFELIIKPSPHLNVIKI